MQSEKKYQICVIGAGCVDYFFEVKDFPKKGENITAHNHFTAPGGKGANQAMAAARLLGEAIYAGQLGEDENGNNVIKDLEKGGVNVKYVRKLKGVPTASGFITITDTGDNNIITVSGASVHYDDKTKLPQEYTDAIDQSNILLLQREIPNEINILAAKYAKSKGKLVCMDVGGKDDPWSDDLLSNLDFVSPNETELERLIGQHFNNDLEEVVRAKLLKKYPNLKVLLKLGAHGAGILTADYFIKVKAVTAFNENILNDHKIVDVTGAGDCFMGAFFVRYSELSGKYEGPTLYEKCMKYANAAAFLCITQRGCIPAMPDEKQVLNFVEKYLDKHGIL